MENEPESSETPKIGEKDTVKFARPVFARELITDEAKKNFDSLPSWQRQLIKRLIDHGDFERAAQEAGVSTYANKNVNVELAEKLTMTEALHQGGLDNATIVGYLKECLDAKTIKFDNHQKPTVCVDLNLKLKTLEMVCKLKGLFEKEKKPNDDNKGVVELFKDTRV